MCVLAATARKRKKEETEIPSKEGGRQRKNSGKVNKTKAARAQKTNVKAEERTAENRAKPLSKSNCKIKWWK